MIYAVIGHRGVGKTELLKRIQVYQEPLSVEVICVDLDEVISKNESKSISEIFAEQGEAAFRNLERKYFSKLLQQFKSSEKTVYVAIGAGFEFEIPEFVRVLWLRRKTDSSERYFLNRPNLDHYSERILTREERYRQLYDFEILIDEGETQPNSMEKTLLGFAPGNLGGYVTLLPEVLESERRFETFLRRCSQLGVHRIELRDDFLTNDQITEILKEHGKKRFLISFRKTSGERLDPYVVFETEFDWAVELGQCPYGEPDILSLHELAEHQDLESAADQLIETPAKHYKLSPPIESLVELWQMHKWQQVDSKKRSFLPRSIDGRWQWYRLFWSTQSLVNFYYFAEPVVKDQISIFERLKVLHPKENFAAILGQPVAKSFTPSEQAEFFAKWNYPVLRILMGEEDVNDLNMGILKSLGLVAAAVTSPLKKTFHGFCQRLSREAYNLKAVNTIIWSHDKNEWLGANTDIFGLRSVFSEMNLPDKIAVWGSGGMRSTLLKTIPEAVFFRARTGASTPTVDENFAPELVVWTVGRSRQKDCLWPPEHWKPKIVFDLNYSEDSPGKEYAAKVKAEYISGEDFFRKQAAEQRIFWQEHLPKLQKPEAQL